MKLWPTTTKNKCFVKMLWHLLSECVKATILLVCSICTFFFFSNRQFVLFFLIYKSANARTVFLHCTSSVFALYIYNAILCWAIVFIFWIVATLSSWFNQLCWAKIHYSIYNFFGMTFCFFFFVLNCSYSTKQHCSYSSYSFFFFLVFCLYFFFF